MPGTVDAALRSARRLLPERARVRLKRWRRILGRVRELEEELLQLRAEVWRLEHARDAGTLGARPAGSVCRVDDFASDWYGRWHEALLGPWDADLDALSDYQLRRKYWEWCAIAELLERRGMLEEGRRGLGFAVGREPLPSLLARHGVEVLATDLDASDESARSWARTDQHAGTLEALWHGSIVDRERFERRVRFRPADMRDLAPLHDSGPFDFVWSSCAMEHLGGLEAGLRFVVESSRLLRPGGVALHTTELNLSSDLDTLEQSDAAIYRARDLRALGERLRAEGLRLGDLDLDPGTHEHDRRFDVEPYYSSRGRQHVKLAMGGHVTTSILLVIDAPAPD